MSITSTQKAVCIVIFFGLLGIYYGEGFHSIFQVSGQSSLASTPPALLTATTSPSSSPSLSFGDLIQAGDLNAKQLASDNKDVTGAVLIECTGRCAKLQPASCLKGLTPLYVKKRGMPSIKDWKVEGSLGANDTITMVNGTVVALYSGNTNINHGFHDDFWPLLAYYSEPQHCVNTTIIAYAESDWLASLIQVAASAYKWNLVQIRQPQKSWICSRDSNVYLNGKSRVLEPKKIPQIGGDLRNVALKMLAASPAATNSQAPGSKEQIVVYTREDSPYRQVKGAEALVALFDSDRFDVRVEPHLPSNFEDQVRFFSNVSLLVAPNGGWAPNVLWLPRNACLFEIHLYKTDSWIAMFGLKALFAKEGDFQTVTGNYNNLSVEERLKRPHRQGGDDDIMGHLLAPALQKTLKKSSKCKRFLLSQF